MKLARPMIGPVATAVLLLAIVPGWAAAEVPYFWNLPVPAQGPAPPGHSPLVQRIDADACGLCHPAQMRDWSLSRHRLAVSPGLVGQLDAFDLGTQQFCLDCHAPREEQQLLWRNSGLNVIDKLHGIDCAACHLRGHIRHGPEANEITPHGKTVRMPIFRDAAFCATCHQFEDDAIEVNGKPLENTYAEWRASPYARAGISCQRCHMPEGRHLFQGIHDAQMTRRGLSVRVTRTASGVSLSAGNTGAGHALPTYITPRIRLRITSSDNRHIVEHVIQRSMAWSEDDGWEELADTRLLPFEWVALELELLPRETAIAEVVVEPDADYRDRVYPTLLRALADALKPTAGALLQRAYEEAGHSSYILYRMACGDWGGTDDDCTFLRPVPSGEIGAQAPVMLGDAPPTSRHYYH